MRVVGIVVSAVIASGCDEVWDLEYVPPPPPCAAPIGHDEDGDGADDACDICPGLSDQQDEDEDDDGVGNACDPTLDVTGDSKLRFFAFAAPSDRDHWGTNPDWVVDADAFVHVDLTPSDGSFVAMIDTPPAPPFEVQIAVTIDAADRTMADHVQIYADNAAKIGCTFVHGGPPGNSNFWDTVPASVARLEISGAYNAGTSYVARMTFTATEVKCRIDGQTATNDPLTGTVIAAVPNPPAGILAVNTFNTQLHFDWLMIYKLP